MNGTNLFKIALRALANNKLRAFLTMLGIIIGVASVITMLAIGQGSKKSIQAQISEMGSNMIMIHPGADMRGGVRQDPSAMQTLKLTDYEALRNETNFLSAVSPNVSSSGQLIAGNNNYPSSVNGVGTDYLEIRQLTVDNGTMFTEADIQTSAKVCVIGKTIQDNLFPDGEDPVGRIIRFNQVPFRVTGVLKAKGYNSMGMDQDDVVLAPYTTVMKRLLAQTYLQGIFASALTEDMTDNATEEITGILRRNHKLKDSDAEHHHRPDDHSPRLYRRHIAGSRRYRHHEHHVCIRNGTYPRNRSAHECGRQRSGYSVAIPHRGYPHQHHRRTYRRYHRLRRKLDSKERSPLAYLHTSLERIPQLCRLHGNGSVLRLVSRQESGRLRPDRSDTI